MLALCWICKRKAQYAKKAGAVFSLKHHIVWCPKYRLAVLEHPVELRLKSLSRTVAKERGTVLQVMPDHVHLFVEADPTMCAAEIVNRFKGRTSHDLRQEFPHLRSRMPTLWSRSYYAGSVGNVSAPVIRRYIEAQKGR